MKFRVDALKDSPDSVAAFREEYCRQTLNLELVADRIETVSARSEVAVLGNAAIFSMSLEGARIGRTSSVLSDGDENASLITIPSGSLEVDYRGDRFTVLPGEFHLISHDVWSQLRMLGETALIGTIIPKPALAAGIVKHGRKFFGEVKSTRAVKQLLGNYLATSLQEADGMTERTEILAGAHLQSLAGLLLQEHVGHVAGTITTDLAGQRFATMLACIDRNFLDPDLDVDAVALAGAISRRTANLVFARQGTTITREISTRRLAMARDMLMAGKPERSATEIAYACGFNDLSTFHRRFKARYGYSPGRI